MIATPKKSKRVPHVWRTMPALHPGEMLREEFMKPLGLSANALAIALRVPVTRISEIVRDTALRLANRGLDIARAEMDRHALTCLKGELQLDLDEIAGSIATYRLAISASPDEAALFPVRVLF